VAASSGRRPIPSEFATGGTDDSQPDIVAPYYYNICRKTVKPWGDGARSAGREWGIAFLLIAMELVLREPNFVDQGLHRCH